MAFGQYCNSQLSHSKELPKGRLEEFALEVDTIVFQESNPSRYSQLESSKVELVSI